MSYNLRDCDRDQSYLLPPSLRDWLPEGDLAWFVLDAIEPMNLQEFYVGLRPAGVGGASFPPTIMALLSREFIILVLIANAIAWPAAYYLMSQWIQGFRYRAGISVWIFLLSGALTLFVALATIGLKTVRAVRANPVEALRYE